jgi:tRNA (guanine37-N1)-methyltransferase
VVPRREGEAVRRRLREKGALRTDLRIRREGDHLLLPVSGSIDLGYPLREADFERGFAPIRSYKDLAEVPDEVRPLLPSSVDIVGDIALVRLRPEVRPYATAVGEAILQSQKRLRVVCVDEGVVGPRRVRNVRVVAGEGRTRTRHREFGATFAVDVAEAYFSPRLATEHVRVARQVRPGEVVVDMFAGVGPYAILAAKHAQPRRVYAIDRNEKAVALLEENVRINRAFVVDVRRGDVRTLLPTLPPADRLILDLPHDAFAYLPDAAAAAAKGAIVHYYEILDEGERKARTARLLAAVAEGGRRGRMVGWRVVRTYAPDRKHYAFDFRLT